MRIIEDLDVVLSEYSTEHYMPKRLKTVFIIYSTGSKGIWLIKLKECVESDSFYQDP